MSDPFIGEIRMFGGTYAPMDWAFCDGSLLSVNDYDALFSLIGTIYGGDGQNTFGLPDLRGRVPLHAGNGFAMGQAGGQENVTLRVNQLPTHNHTLMVSNDAPTLGTPQNNFAGQSAVKKYYRAGVPTMNLAPNSLTLQGGSQPHANLQPYLCINFIIALQGIYPQQN